MISAFGKCAAILCLGKLSYAEALLLPKTSKLTQKF